MSFFLILVEALKNGEDLFVGVGLNRGHAWKALAGGLASWSGLQGNSQVAAIRKMIPMVYLEG